MNFPGSYNSLPGGMIPAFYHWGSKQWPIKFLKVVNGAPVCDVMAFPGEYFTGYSLRDVCSFREIERETPKGIIYDYEFSGKVKDRFTLAKVLEFMLRQRHFVVCSDNSDKPRLLGRPGNLAKFTWQFDSEQSGDDDALISWLFTWSSKTPAPFVAFSLCGLLTEDSPLSGYVDEGYWLANYTE